MENSKKLYELLDEFKHKYGYRITEHNEDCGYWKFERTVNGNNHVLLLEDHRWELARPDFNPDTDIGDWLIFSYLTDDVIDWFGNYMDTQYPLTYSEYKLIDKIIKGLEKTDE